MKLASQSPFGELVVATATDHSRLSRQVASGKAVRLAPGLYVIGATRSAEEVARHHLYAVIGHVWPDAVVMGRSAFAGGAPVDGEIYLAHPNPARRTPLVLPGVVVVPFVGPAALPGDMSLPNNLWLSGPARQLVENVSLRGRQPRFREGTNAVDNRIDEFARSGGSGRIKQVLEQLEAIHASFDPTAIEVVRTRLVSVLGTFTKGGPAFNERLAARVAGLAFDTRRIAMIEGLVDVVFRRPPMPCPEYPPAGRWEWLPFFEAYFSNFIEGTQFGVDEARRIATEGEVPTARPADGHDVSATFRLAGDGADRCRIPGTSTEFIDLLRARHEVLMAARPEKNPGEFKTKRNFAGGYEFVEPELVIGTLVKGFQVLDRLRDPLARATGMMALITECHPFDDGNGRIARLAANAELSAAGEVRVIIPTVLRNNYLAALSGFSNGAGHGEQLIAVLEFAQRWVTEVDWSTFERANGTVTDCNAYVDSSLAETSGRRLRLPSSLP